MDYQRPTHHPIGTRAELDAHGIDPDMAGCCGPHLKGIQRGCQYWDSCMHNKKALGGFKGQGPRNVAYYIEPAPGEGAAMEASCPCFIFVGTLQNRMLAGMDRKNRGLPHETVMLVAVEGDGRKYLRRVWTTDAPDGGNKSKNYKMHHTDEEIEVAPFLRLGQNPQVTMSQKLQKRQEERESFFNQVEDEAAERAMGRAGIVPPEPDFELGATELVPATGGEPESTADPSVPLAAPVGRAKRA